ncbi:hypothetical protein NQ317_003533 [Molorchus minor]|uniref:Uncharacterized protein n=1 Tax=Molorchus minor TaxID=1323400 RepID=A0ABQ9K194_9CUCU|nr:hypothetical protein NQ317_003533 [Molorchus minor]
MLTVPGLVDAFMEADDIPSDLIATNESLRNSYTPSHLIKKNVPGKRIDYVMYHPGSRVQVELKKYTLPLSDRVPNFSFSYSDHEAIDATLLVHRKEVSMSCIDLEQKKSILEESVHILNEALNRVHNHKVVYWLFASVLLVILVISLVLDTPFGYNVLFNILKTLVTVLMIFSILMATIWNNIERHAIISGKLAMDVTLKRLNVNKCL